MAKRLRSWWQNVKKHWKVIVVTISIVVILMLIVLIALGYLNNWPWAGLNPNAPSFHGITLWNWLQLLIIPAVLAVGALLFNRSTTLTEQNIAKKRYEQDQEIALDKQRGDILQIYLDRMSDLLLKEGLGLPGVKPEVRNMAKVRTITALIQLDARRIGYVFSFLRQSGLMTNESNDSIVSLYGADLNNINLSKANLNQTNFSRAYLNGADFSQANLILANLSNANLSNANLSNATLEYATLHNANFNSANLSGAVRREVA